MKSTTKSPARSKKAKPDGEDARKQPPKPAASKSRTLVIHAMVGEADRETARVTLAHLPAARVVADFGHGIAGGELSLMDTIAVLGEKAKAVNGGSLEAAEALLMSQAQALNVVFGALSRRAALNMGQYLEAAEKYMRLALKAQGQCRATLETLAAIKNPPVLFAKQANIANGPQQVNNGSTSIARAENANIAPNKLLEENTGTQLDIATASTAGGSDPALATVGEIDRPAH